MTMRLADDIAVLIRVPLFADLSSDHLRLLAFGASRLELPAGQVLFSKSAPASSSFVVMAGEIAMTDPDRPQSRSLASFGPGTLLGETALFIETWRPATAVAVIDSQILEIDRALMLRMLDEYPDVAIRLHAKLTDTLTNVIDDIWHLRPRLDAVKYPEYRPA